MPHERVLVAMSGGVDSSVAAAMLVEQGYEVIGVTMKLFHQDDDMPSRPRSSDDAIRNAAAVAEHIGIAHHVLDLAESFERQVIQEFVAEYERGRTPIPCVVCNSFVKFGDLLTFADELGCRLFATGHYAIVKDGALYKGKDRQKDQTYFLWAIEHAALDRLLLPLGELTKVKVRETARQLGLGNAERSESVEICFVPDDDYVAILKQYLPADSPALSPGKIVRTTGELVGEHNGYARYTIGQRRGLPGGFPEAMYVTSILPEERTVVIGTENELFGSAVRLESVNWLGPPLGTGDRCRVSTRYRSRLVDGQITGGGDATDDSIMIELNETVRAITSGQSGVLYDGNERLLGGGIIV
jgi:tRNA-specific 2-thiouridylase